MFDVVGVGKFYVFVIDDGFGGVVDMFVVCVIDRLVNNYVVFSKVLVEFVVLYLFIYELEIVVIEVVCDFLYIGEVECDVLIIEMICCL